jgi:hypothetical protein
MLRSATALVAVVGLSGSIAYAQSRNVLPRSTITAPAAGSPAASGVPTTPLNTNQTQGYGAGKLLTFTYGQQFDCVVQPGDDRNFKGVEATVDPAQFNTPECQIAAPSSIDPTGAKVSANTPVLWVIVPFFETNKNEPAFTPALGSALKKLFGFVPDAFKPVPGVPVQCPEQGTPYTKFKGAPGTCTMHPTNIDLGPVLTALGLEPKHTNLYLPLVNHSHVLADNAVNLSGRWWLVVVDLVTSPKAWPNAAGTTGINSLAALRKAQAAKESMPDVSSNFYLYFSSQEEATMSSGMRSGMRM